MLIQQAFERSDLLSGVTMVDATELPWPGYSFAPTPMVSETHLAQSYDALARSLSVDRSMIVTATQVHGSDIVVIGDDYPEPSIQADALITHTTGWVLGVKLADCCGVLLYDATLQAIAAVHSGWRGTAQNIVGKVVSQMRDTYGTQPSDLKAWLSPCASGTTYLVREDVASVLSEFCTPVLGQSSQWTFDNHRALTSQLKCAGVNAASIQLDPSCTIADARWHSYRRDGVKAGRMLAFIGLRPMAGK
jgi:YfiH family protein